jgi:hypothetical protein
VKRQNVSDNQSPYYSGQGAGNIKNVFKNRQKRAVGNKQSEKKGYKAIEDKAATYPDKGIQKRAQKIRILENLYVILHTGKDHGRKTVPVKETHIDCKNRRHYKKGCNKDHRGH